MGDTPTKQISRFVQELYDGLDSIDAKIAEAALLCSPGGWNLTTQASLALLQPSAPRNTEKHGDELARLVRSLRWKLEKGDRNRAFDYATFIILKNVVGGISAKRVPWGNWYDSTEAIGSAAWRAAVPTNNFILSTNTMNDETISLLTNKFAALDRVLDVVRIHLLKPGRRVKFSEEFHDTMYVHSCLRRILNVPYVTHTNLYGDPRSLRFPSKPADTRRSTSSA